MFYALQGNVFTSLDQTLSFCMLIHISETLL